MQLKKSFFISALVAAAAFATHAMAAESVNDWAVDVTHARVGFSVSHIMISRVDGQFRKFSGSANIDPKDLTKSQAELSIDAASIDTGDANRDTHLKNADFLDVAKYPKVTFKSTKITKNGKGYKLVGNLSLHGVTKEVSLDATVSDMVPSPFGKPLRAVRIVGKIDRRDFGLTWNKALDKGGVAIGNEVQLDINTEINPSSPST